MAINKKLIHFKNRENFDNEVANGNILDNSIVFIQDTLEIYTHGTFYDGKLVDLSNIEASILNILDTKLDTIADLESIRSGAALGATALQALDLSNYATSVNGLINNINSNINNVASDVANVRRIAEAALTKATNNESTISQCATKAEIMNKQDVGIKFSNVLAEVWVEDETYSDFKYRCDMACSGVTSDMYAEVVFEIILAASGNYAPICETGAGIVSIWASVQDAITVPVIIITK